MKFGTSGLRGRVSDMTDPVVAAHTRAFLDHLAGTHDTKAQAGGHALLVGRDLRPSSPRIADTCMSAAQATGLAVVDCGVLPTPALALAAQERGCPALMVTGSHIPFDRNGLKFYRPSGEITKADEAGIAQALSAAKTAPRQHSAADRKADGAPRQRYVERCLAILPERALAGLRIGLYEHSAAGRDLMAHVFAGLGAEVISFGRTDGFIPIDTEAVRPEDAALARDMAETHRLDAVISTDGDGDRPLMADETGAILRGDILGILTARFLGADAVATPISSNSALERTGWFREVARTRIGSPHVIAAMDRLRDEGARCAVGFEANGGFLLGGVFAAPSGAMIPPLPTRDAMLPVLATLGLSGRTGLPLSRLAQDLPRRFTASDRLPDFPQAHSTPLLARLAAEAGARAAFLRSFGETGSGAPDLLDGVRMPLAGDEIVHLRASGNAPELRCYAEAAEPGRARALVAAALAAVSDRFARG